jgi:hypothetical protein
VPYDIGPESIQDLIVKLRELVQSKVEVNRDMCWIYLERLDRYSKVVRVWFQVYLPSWDASLFYGNRVLHDIQILFESMHIPFALPTQTLQLRTQVPFEGGEGEQPAPVILPDLEEGKPST